jgi:hypothetical protein
LVHHGKVVPFADGGGCFWDALHDEVREWIRRGVSGLVILVILVILAIAVPTCGEEPEGFGGEGRDVHVGCGEHGARALAHLVESETFPLQREQRVHRARRGPRLAGVVVHVDDAALTHR